MTPDRDELAKVLGSVLYGLGAPTDWTDEAASQGADAVLAVLPQYEQCGWRKGRHFLLWRADHDSAYMLGRGWMPVYIVREAEG